jgi:DNA replication and repair protein RecF
MLLKELALTNFRSYEQMNIEFPPGLVLLHGSNAQGKSNLLEAVCYLALARSPRTRSDGEVVNWLAKSQPQPFVRIWGRVQKGERLQELEVRILGAPGEVEGSMSWRKRIAVDGVPGPVAALLGNLRLVLFRPQDLELVDGGPSLRRRYMDMVLCQLDLSYYRSLRGYNRVLYRRNHLLRQLRGRSSGQESMDFWDQKLAEQGAFLMERRRWALWRIDDLLGGIHSTLTGDGQQLNLHYQPSLRVCKDEVEAGPGLKETTDYFMEELRELREKEVRQGVTLVGPHRDDFGFTVGDVDLRLYGSRGQQRMAALSLKMAELELVREETGERPLLLLDDVMSELDPQRRCDLGAMVRSQKQAILTTTDLTHCPAELVEGASVFLVENSQVIPQ